MKRIIYPTDDGVAVIVPAAECGLTIEEIAAKDVPEGKPYKIVDVADIPTDRTFRNASRRTRSNTLSRRTQRSRTPSPTPISKTATFSMC